MATSVKEKPLERLVEGAILRHCLTKIEFKSNGKTVWAVAHPHPWHPLVTTRRETEMAEAANGGSISIKEATDVTLNALRPVAQASANTFAEALASLEDALKALKKA